MAGYLFRLDNNEKINVNLKKYENEKYHILLVNSDAFRQLSG